MYNWEIKFLQCWGSNLGFLVSEATALPTEPPPLPVWWPLCLGSLWRHCWPKKLRKLITNFSILCPELLPDSLENCFSFSCFQLSTIASYRSSNLLCKHSRTLKNWKLPRAHSSMFGVFETKFFFLGIFISIRNKTAHWMKKWSLGHLWR